MLPADPLPGLRERKKVATKERLYVEALDLFRRKGFAATTLEMIAEAAEVSKGTFFNYYPSKEALLSHLSERLAATTAEALETALAAGGLTARAKLTLILQTLAAAVQADRELTQVALFELLKRPAAIVADPYRRLLRQAVSALLAAGQRQGEVATGLDPDLWSSAITGMYFQQIFEWCAAETPYPLGERLARMIDGLWHGIGA